MSDKDAIPLVSMWDTIDRLVDLSAQSIENEIDPERNPERRNYYRFLYHLVKWRKPKIALEIGVEAGFASAYMCRAAKEYGRVVGVDHQNIISVPLPEDYIFMVCDSREAGPGLTDIANQYGKIGVVFQDSSHHYEKSRQEWDLIWPLLDHNAIWVCDDITPAFHDPLIDPPGLGMVQYFEERPGEKRLYPDILHHGNIQGIIIINKE